MKLSTSFVVLLLLTTLIVISSAYNIKEEKRIHQRQKRTIGNIFDKFKNFFGFIIGGKKKNSASPTRETPTQTYGAPSQAYGIPSGQFPKQPYGRPSVQRPTQTYGRPSVQRPTQTYSRPGVQRPTQTYNRPGGQRPTQTYSRPPGGQRPTQTYSRPGGQVPSQTYSVAGGQGPSQTYSVAGGQSQFQSNPGNQASFGAPSAQFTGSTTANNNNNNINFGSQTGSSAANFVAQPRPISPPNSFNTVGSSFSHESLSDSVIQMLPAPNLATRRPSASFSPITSHVSKPSSLITSHVSKPSSPITSHVSKPSSSFPAQPASSFSSSSSSITFPAVSAPASYSSPIASPLSSFSSPISSSNPPSLIPSTQPLLPSSSFLSSSSSSSSINSNDIDNDYFNSPSGDETFLQKIPSNGTNPFITAALSGIQTTSNNNQQTDNTYTSSSNLPISNVSPPSTIASTVVVQQTEKQEEVTTASIIPRGNTNTGSHIVTSYPETGNNNTNASSAPISSSGTNFPAHSVNVLDTSDLSLFNTASNISLGIAPNSDNSTNSNEEIDGELISLAIEDHTPSVPISTTKEPIVIDLSQGGEIDLTNGVVNLGNTEVVDLTNVNEEDPDILAGYNIEDYDDYAEYYDAIQNVVDEAKERVLKLANDSSAFNLRTVNVREGKGPKLNSEPNVLQQLTKDIKITDDLEKELETFDLIETAEEGIENLKNKIEEIKVIDQLKESIEDLANDVVKSTKEAIPLVIEENSVTGNDPTLDSSILEDSSSNADHSIKKEEDFLSNKVDEINNKAASAVAAVAAAVNDIEANDESSLSSQSVTEPVTIPYVEPVTVRGNIEGFLKSSISAKPLTEKRKQLQTILDELIPVENIQVKRGISDWSKRLRNKQRLNRWINAQLAQQGHKQFRHIAS